MTAGRLGPMSTVRLVALATLIGAAGACSPAPSEPTGEPVVLTGRDAGFVLTLRIGSNVVDAGAPIDAAAQLTWEGAAPKAAIWGSGGGPVAFGLKQLDGPIELGPAMTGDCARHEFARLVPVEIPYKKSGGWSADDPNAGFYRTFFADPVLRLPSGRWRLDANVSGFLVPCEANAPTVDITVVTELLVR